ncbi:MAG: hypothetical protein A2730_01535 [Candidatus Staskawiczbacteria bacterium RIFCSPHIGHO2_01_FULL_39_25]|uniref:ATP-cone domain-containing protein n=1 Tax=Candidatus Staskawiczbacteria bacterium RIFCSPHIGHO2_01_FULL_39_25 TaxID=1802202 RepID=A0A1G2HN76_9BACT|nr:hypothetical protein [Candidatus Woesearchaeota archaeon]OGZ63984.1 MAG: hypothetical protein A2730_01535 [Candidatus Staskawiczbacteria bacterium RIFCSPHIGHO2_01_FULL_39_25]
MEQTKYVVKRRNHAHLYDERKVYGSAYAACYVVMLNHRACEKIANKVTKNITTLVHKKKTISSTEIFHHVIRELKKHNKNAAFMYETHRDIA